MRNPLLVPALALLLGVWLWPHWMPGSTACLVAVCACCLLGCARGRGGSWALLAAGFWLGSAAPSLIEPGPELRGTVSVGGEVLSSSGRRMELALDRVGSQPASGRVTVLSPDAPPAAGTSVGVFGMARPSWDVALPGDVDPELDARTRGVRTLVLARLVASSTGPRPQPFGAARHEGLLQALAFGDRTLASDDDIELLRETGTLHLLSVSGLHVGLLAGLAALVTRGLVAPLALWHMNRLVQWAPVVVGVVVAFSFATFVGWPVSARRASWMLAGALIASASGRAVRLWNLLAAAAVCVALGDPGAVRSVSFGLSFGAVTGLVAIAPRLERYLPPDAPRWLTWPVRSVAATLGASLGTLPMSAWTFQAFPVAAPLANLVAVPLVSCVALPAAVLASQGWLFPMAVADTAWDLVLRWLALIEGPIWTPAVGGLGALGVALALPARGRLRASIALLALGLTSLPAGPRVTFLAIGQGDAALVEGTHTVLVDGGPPSDRVLRYLRRRGLRHLDEVVVSHPHPDHYGGLLPVLEELEVDAVRVSRAPLEGEDDYARLWAICSDRGIPLLGPAHPTLPEWEVLHPSPEFLDEHAEDANEVSLVMRLTLAERSFLFTGDVEDAGESALGEVGPVDVLKVAHHGSRTSSSPELLAELDPLIAVIPVGRESRYGHPHAITLHTLVSARVYRTDLDGSVQLEPIPDGLRVRTWRPAEGWSGWTVIPARRPVPFRPRSLEPRRRSAR
ncbi:MAG: MBL fold metallo-hydrolase [Proteobacteria bacterium]|nr:MBL fold metallo-hydrolase [Pseudomonadota bacterium]